MNSQAGRIVVGYDGTEHSAAALEWAAVHAQHRDRPLTVLHVVDYAGMIASPLGPFGWPDVHDEKVAAIARAGAELARKQAGSIDISAVTRVAPVAGALIEFAGSAEMLVVGTRGHGDLAGSVLGSVAFAVGGHASCPVVVVRGRVGAPGSDRPVMVGVDCSSGSETAVRYAADLAAAAPAPLIIVCGYRIVASPAWTEAAYYDLESGGRPNFTTVARESAQNAVISAARTARTAHPELKIREQILEGVPARALIRAADQAGILVVGSRGHGGFAGLKLGSVSHALIHAAPCPVAIVH